MITKQLFQDSWAFCKGNHDFSICSDFQNLGIQSRVGQVKKVWIVTTESVKIWWQTFQFFIPMVEILVLLLLILVLRVEMKPAQLKAHQVKLRMFYPALLSAILVQVRDQSVVAHNSAALLNSGSKSNFLTSDLVSKLGFLKRHVNISVVGIAHVEECHMPQILSKEELEYGNYFKPTYQRKSKRRFIITIP